MFALEQQLAWYRGTAKEQVTTVAAVADDMELRQPPMPDEQAYADATRRGQHLFGAVLPQWRSPANLAETARTLRTAARSHAAAVAELAGALERHAEPLGLDPQSGTGRLATARRIASFLEQIAGEQDDVVLVEQVARVDLGGVEDHAAGVTIKQAAAVTGALAQTRWAVLDAALARSTSDERAQVVLNNLHYAARHEQHAADLVAALGEAVDQGVALLAVDAPPPQPVSVRPVPVEPVPAGPDAGEPVRAAGGGSRTVAGVAEWETVAAEIRGQIEAGHRVRVSWEIG